MSYDVSLEIDTGNGHTIEAFSRNYTSNCAPMWRKAGVNLADHDGGLATYLLPELRAAVAAMEADPETYRAMNPPNGWGDYDGCLEFLRGLRDACEQHPATMVRVSR